MKENEEKEDTEMQSACDEHANLPRETRNFHAVYVPPDSIDEDKTYNKEECVHIYQNKEEALQVIKIHKKARMKTFKNLADAEAYVKHGLELPTIKISTVAKTQEKPSNFKALRPQELVGFKKLIENGNLDKIKNYVWENPRYLISNGDTPAILQVGSRYNALHIAAKANKPQICEFILNTVGHSKFLQLHHGEKEERNNLNLMEIMLDLYLNTPDKGLNETPLHFAAKFGYRDVVRVLVSYSQCIKTLQNKYEQMPVDVICTRKCQEDENLKREIRLLLEDQFYVPVLRAEGNICPPTIGEPFSPTSPPTNLNRDPISPRVEVRAFAGPMTKSQAVEFRKKWKTPPRITPRRGQGDASCVMNSPIALRLQDTEKGLECVGRNLAEEYRVSWKEYWPFLKDFVDFRTDKGLTKLEEYLEEKYKEQLYCFMMKNLTNDTATNARQQTPEKSFNNDIQDLCDKLRLCLLLTEDEEAEENTEFFTPPSSPEPSQEDSDDDMLSAEEEDEEDSIIFIEGSLPTRVDYAVYNALSSTICSYTFPNVYRWRHDMQLAMKRDPNR
ncbi:Ankyrin repeat and LEM domain-containing protein [Ooceraea biroi]|nr:Ankyrin repeat and LEM domain-containing protein [Ooceraea biroi]